ncbi:MAG: NADH-quinone oxidoreductase subunit J [Candidatus Sumerlaeia bacterium]|nr:NADH-quinone oxidoreductase subunit J [Candidatus Sumerlaeia bacterium]
MFDLFYYLIFALTVLGAGLVLFTRDTVKSAMALILVMVCLAVNFLMMQNEFVALIQIIIYAGAIMVVFLFVVMLLNLREREQAPWYLRDARFWGGALALAFFLLAAFGVKTFAAAQIAGGHPIVHEPSDVTSIATSLVTFWVLPFLLTSVILLVAVIGAVAMARRQDEDGNEITIDTE